LYSVLNSMVFEENARFVRFSLILCLGVGFSILQQLKDEYSVMISRTCASANRLSLSYLITF